MNMSCVGSGKQAELCDTSMPSWQQSAEHHEQQRHRLREHQAPSIGRQSWRVAFSRSFVITSVMLTNAWQEDRPACMRQACHLILKLAYKKRLAVQYTKLREDWLSRTRTGQKPDLLGWGRKGTSLLQKMSTLNARSLQEGEERDFHVLQAVQVWLCLAHSKIL